jgi:hypothetical protein
MFENRMTKEEGEGKEHVPRERGRERNSVDHSERLLLVLFPRLNSALKAVEHIK